LNSKLFTEKGKKFKFSAQGRDLTPFVGNRSKVKIHFEIKLPLIGIRIRERILWHLK
jgi:hypothetical protein